MNKLGAEGICVPMPLLQLRSGLNPMHKTTYMIILFAINADSA